MSFIKIAEKLGSTEWTVARRVYEWGLSEPRTTTNVDRDELARLVRAGLSFTKIGERLGCSENTVARRVNKWCLSRRRAPR
jgi:DNA-binding Lrp family transcriptional regulator